MTYQTTFQGQKIVANDFRNFFNLIANLIKGQDCRICHGKGAYLVANGEDDQDWEYCQH